MHLKIHENHVLFVLTGADCLSKKFLSALTLKKSKFKIWSTVSIGNGAEILENEQYTEANVFFLPGSFALAEILQKFLRRIKGIVNVGWSKVVSWHHLWKFHKIKFKILKLFLAFFHWYKQSYISKIPCFPGRRMWTFWLHWTIVLCRSSSFLTPESSKLCWFPLGLKNSFKNVL